MLRILGQIWISGNKAGLEPLVQASAIPSGKLEQMGLKRKVPDVDSWFYGSPCYQFHWESLDEELYSFIESNRRIKPFLIPWSSGLQYAHLQITPVDQSFEETFSCLLSRRTINLLSELGLGLEIAPEVTMPEFPFWIFAEISPE